MPEDAAAEPLAYPEDPSALSSWWPFSARSTLLLAAACMASLEVSLCVAQERWIEVAVPFCTAAVIVFSTNGEAIPGTALGAYGLMLSSAGYWFWNAPEQDFLTSGLVNAGIGAVFGGAIHAVNDQHYLIGIVAPVAYMAFFAFQW